MLKIDNLIVQVPVLELTRKGDFLDKYAKRTEDGVLHRELIGVYFNYQLRLGGTTNRAEYQRLWQKLCEPVEFHTVTVPACGGSYTFCAYFAGVGDRLLRTYEGRHYWDDLTVNFIAQAPAGRAVK